MENKAYTSLTVESFDAFLNSVWHDSYPGSLPTPPFIVVVGESHEHPDHWLKPIRCAWRDMDRERATRWKQPKEPIHRADVTIQGVPCCLRHRKRNHGFLMAPGAHGHVYALTERGLEWVRSMFAEMKEYKTPGPPLGLDISELKPPQRGEILVVGEFFNLRRGM